jgi:hypothetical protein
VLYNSITQVSPMITFGSGGVFYLVVIGLTFIRYLLERIWSLMPLTVAAVGYTEIGAGLSNIPMVRNM